MRHKAINDKIMDARNTHTQPGTPASTPVSAAHWADSLSNQSMAVAYASVAGRIPCDMSDSLLLWADVETTSLNPAEGDLLEVGLRYTDMGLHQLDDGLSTPIRWTGTPGPFTRAMHTPNGLLEACRTAPPLAQAIVWARRYVERGLDGHTVLLAGSSVSFDRAWLNTHMPGVLDGLHHRILDVSSLLVAVQAWAPGLADTLPGHETNQRVDTCLDGSMATCRTIMEDMRCAHF